MHLQTIPVHHAPAEPARELRIHTATSATADTASHDATWIQMPNEIVGRLLDNGRGSIYALHLVAIKVSHGTGFVLNEKHVAKPFDRGGYDIGRRSFRAAIRLLKGTSVLDRHQRQRRFATEQLLQPGSGHVRVPRYLLRIRSDLLAFIITVNLSPTPQRPEAVARRIGIKGRVAIRLLAKQAIKLGEVASETRSRGAIWLARKGHIFDQVENVPAENVPAENVPTQSQLTERAQRTETNTEKSVPPSQYENPAVRGGEGDFIRLNDWTATAYFKSLLRGWENLERLRAEPPPFHIRTWADTARRLGLPQHLSTPSAHIQACEIANLLTWRCRGNGRRVEPTRCLEALAHEIALDVRRGRTIRSFGLAAERLYRRACDGDLSWAFDWPTTLSPEEVQSAHTVALRAIRILEGRCFNHLRRELLSTSELEQIHSLVENFGRDMVLRGIEETCRQKDIGDQSVIGWQYFRECIQDEYDDDDEIEIIVETEVH